MDNIEITGTEHALYNTFIELYSNSFPIFEQRTQAQQASAFSTSNYHLLAYHENDAFIGFIAYWEFSKYIYIEHFAVNQTLRGKGYGSKVLKTFISANIKRVLLEIDPVVDQVSALRLRFYKNCNFHENKYSHSHPSYRKGYEAHSLEILTTEGTLSNLEYQQFNKDLIEVVMAESNEY